MKNSQHIAILLLRIGLSAGFLSAVASRLGLWGKYSSGWNNFVSYTARVNSFVPQSLIPFIAVMSTLLETAFGIMLLAGYKTSYAATGAAFLTFLFFIAMSVSAGLKEPLDYSVLAFSAGAFLLATMPEYRWSIDQLLIHK